MALDHRVRKVLVEKPGHKAIKDFLDQLEDQVHLDQEDSLVYLDQLDLEEKLVRQGLLDHLVHLVTEVVRVQVDHLVSFF